MIIYSIDIISIAGIDLEEKTPEQYMSKYPAQENYHVNINK